MAQRAPAHERFEAKITVLDTACHVWQGHINERGYGKFWNGTKMVRAHRFAYELATNAPIPAGLEVDHICRNRACVNVSHLQLVTPVFNKKLISIRNKREGKRSA